MYRVGGLFDLSTSGLLRYLVNHASASTPADLPTHVPRSHPPPLGGRVEEDGDDEDVEVEAMSVSAQEGFVRGSDDDDRRLLSPGCGQSTAAHGYLWKLMVRVLCQGHLRVARAVHDKGW